MSTIKFILQGINTQTNHISALNELFSLSDITFTFISVAFMKSEGVNSISQHLKAHSNNTTVLVGIRNGITSAQALLELLKLGIKPCVVDTGSPSITFHPKIYLTQNDSQAHCIIGSANATTGGYSINIEASTFLYLDKSNTEDNAFLSSIYDSFNTLIQNHPENIYQIQDFRDVVRLLNQGKLVDERTSHTKLQTGQARNKSLDKTPRMKLSTQYIQPSSKRTQRKIHTFKSQPSVTTLSQSTLVWQSNTLTERDLNIPSGPTAHKTGSMTLKKGAWLDIDQRHYFREIVFAELNWLQSNPRYPHLEYASANFELIIDGISYGSFHLSLTHDPRTNTKSYDQNNAMTHLKWGEIKDFIADRSLLTKTAKLYKLASNRDFIIEIS